MPSNAKPEIVGEAQPVFFLADNWIGTGKRQPDAVRGASADVGLVQIVSRDGQLYGPGDLGMQPGRFLLPFLDVEPRFGQIDDL